MNFGEILHVLRKNLDLTQGEVAQQIGVKKNTVSNYENNISKPHYEQLVKLCDLLECSPNTLMNGDLTLNEDILNPADKQIISQYHSLSKNNKSIVDYILDIEKENIDSLQDSKVIYKFPVYEQEAAAGAGITGRDGKFTMCDIFADDIPSNAVFGVHIRGTSMINTNPSLRIDDIPDGSIVLLNPKVSSSDLDKTIVVASINDEVICKRFLIKQDCIHFYSLNRKEHAQDDRFAKSSDDYRIIGQVVKIIKPTEYE